ncbi:MAG: serine/threonine protein phosphatase [Oscillospiraceae bacterium]|nr:serine/threonine protein phosphatase [Oscillospiraceae bacterium]
MIYVMSDIHGCYGSFQQMLDKICFTDEDDLYILGDFIDRGEAPIPLLLDCMDRINVYPLIGNHEAIMLQCVADLPDEATFDNITEYYTPMGMEFFQIWMANGGESTCRQFFALSPQRRQELIAYISEFRLYDELTMPDGRKFLMTHSGIEDFDPAKPIEEYDPDALINARPEQGNRFFEDKTLVFGHTPTLTYPHMHGRAEVIFTDTYINIDCGAVFREAGGRLACLRLDDSAVFYI